MAMAKAQKSTRDLIVAAAEKLFYAEGIRAVSVDAVAEAAGVTKRTLYYHFDSKDELIAAYLEGRDQPNLKLFRKWFDAGDGDVVDKVEAIFVNLARTARHPKWKGCGFLRTSAELANMPGHPAIRIGAAHKKKFEAWMAETFAEAGAVEPAALAKQILLLLDGSFAVVLLQRDAGYMDVAGRAAATLVRLALVGANAKTSSERVSAST